MREAKVSPSICSLKLPLHYFELYREDDVSKIEAELEADLLNQSLNRTKFNKEEVDLLLPSFKIEADLQLKEILKNIGIV